MPTYTYRCEDCGHQFDIFQHFTDDSLTECPECGKQTLHKVYSPVGVVFKGSGFYCTDHKSPSGQTSPRHEHETSSSDGTTADSGAKVSGDSSKSETPAAKPAENKS